MRSMLKRIIKPLAAVLIFAVLFMWVQEVVSGTNDNRDAIRISGFYEQKENSLDAVFIGSSATYAFWIAPYAWHEYGVTVYPYATAAMTLEPLRFVVEECRKTQPDALYIINITSMYDDSAVTSLHRLFNELPLSMTKLRAIDYACKSLNLTFSERMELYFPILRFHDRWYELGPFDLNRRGNKYKGANTYNAFFSKNESFSGSIPFEPKIIDLPVNIVNTINDLIDYLEKEDVKFMFVVSPQVIQHQIKYDAHYSATQLINERGYQVLNMNELIEEIGINYSTDYYNAAHTNFHGALKVTSFLCEHIMENYDITDKRGDPAYADWDEAYARFYYDKMEPHLKDYDMPYLNAPIPDRP